MNTAWMDQQMYVAMEHHRAGRLAAAEDAYQRVLRQQPDHFNALANLGVLAHQVKKHDAAVQLLRRALQINPQSGETYSNLAAALRAMKKFEEAAEACRQAIQFKPNHADAYSILGNCLTDLDQFDQALAAYQMAVQIDPNSSAAQTNLGGGFSDQGRYAESIASHRRAIELDPHNPSAHWNLALNLLLQGDLRGWDEYEWRWKLPAFTSSPRKFSQPLWNGAPLNGQTILLHAEQGFGDAIQFVRYVPLVIAAGGRVILECPQPLRALFCGIADVSQVVVAGQPLADFHLHCPLLSLPLVLGTRFALIPPAPYLSVDMDLAAKWKAMLPALAGKMRVGLAWAGRPTHGLDRHRSIALAAFARLGQVEGVQFFSLQTGRSDPVPAGLSLIDLTENLSDFSETAAFIENLDLVITVDTAIAHLAGSIGKPVWVLLMKYPEWRWLLDRDDSPWYASMKLFRQSQMDQWEDVIDRIGIALAERQS